MIRMGFWGMLLCSYTGGCEEILCETVIGACMASSTFPSCSCLQTYAARYVSSIAYIKPLF